MGKGRRTKRQEEEVDSPVETTTENTAPVSKGKKKKAARKQQQQNLDNDSASDKEGIKETWEAASSDDAPPVKKGGKSPAKNNAFAMLQDDSESESEEIPVGSPTPIKGGGMNAFALLMNSDSDTTEISQSVQDMSVASAQSADINTGVVDPFEEETDEDDKPKKKKGGNKKQQQEPEIEAADEPVTRVKTKAEKAAEKKERDKKKKEQQKARQKAKQEEKEKENDEFAAALAEAGVVFAEDYPEEKKGKKKKKKGKQEQEEEEEEEVIPAAPPAPEEVKEGEEEGEDGEDDGATGSKKKRKKKKKGERVTKPTAAARKLKEALDELKAEEERLKKEEEEMEAEEDRKEEERLEKMRLEDERKQRRKDKEKERKERKKKEGTWLTKAEREKRDRAQNMLDALKQQGIVVPEKSQDKPSDKPAGKVRYGGRQRKKKPQHTEDQEETSAPVSPVEKIDVKTSQTTVDNDQEIAAAESWEMLDAPKVEAVADSWDVEEVELIKEVEEESEEEEEDEDEEEEEEDEDEDDEDDDDSEEEEDEEEDSEEEDEGLGPRDRIQARIARAERNKDPNVLRAPILCVLGHVDTGKTKILDKIRHTNVQDGEAGGITQQIGATNVPIENVKRECAHLTLPELKIPGMLIIDTPGHESFSNLRSRGSSLCDMAILVIDIMHGLEPQTVESINLLKKRKTPFIVALNKIDRLYEWKAMPKMSVQEALKKQKKVTRDDFDDRCKKTLVEIMEQGLNAKLFYENDDPRQYISIVPTSAHSGDGMADLLVLACDLSQKMLGNQLVYRNTLEAMVLEVKAIHGLGTTVDIILRNGQLREGDNIVLSGIEGAFTTTVRAVLTPQPMKEIRVKSNYIQHKCVQAAQGIKICARNMEQTLAGMPVYVSRRADEVEVLIEDANKALKEELKSIKLTSEGVYVQASTLGSLEALLEFLKQSKIKYAGVSIGPVHKKDVMKASVMLQHDKEFACLLAFDVKVERDAQEMADSLGVRIFTADIIYHLFDQFTAYKEELKDRRKEEHRHNAVFPCRLRILPMCVYNTRDPIVIGVTIINGNLRVGTPLCVPSKEFCYIGVVTSLEMNHKQVDSAQVGQDVCIKIENIGGDAPKLYGRHFDENDVLVSKITRDSIDILKEYFRDDMTKEGWKLVVELKKIFEIM